MNKYNATFDDGIAFSDSTLVCSDSYTKEEALQIFKQMREEYNDDPEDIALMNESEIMQDTVRFGIMPECVEGFESMIKWNKEQRIEKRILLSCRKNSYKNQVIPLTDTRRKSVF